MALPMAVLLDALKLLALFSMTVDHINAVLLDRAIVGMTLVGRIAFPVFAFAAALGALHTRSPRAYLQRLLLCALVAQPFFWLATQMPWWHLNTVFTLLCGVVAVLCVRYGLGYLAPLALLPAISADYSLAGAATVPAAALLLSARPGWRLLGGVSILLLAPSLWPTPASLSIGLATVLAAWLLIDRAAPARGNGPRYTFYVFYPLHLALLVLLAWLLA